MKGTTRRTGVDTRDMLVVHDAVRREFRRAPALVRAVDVGDKARAGVIGDHVELLTSLLHHHHAGEDRVLWPALLPRVPQDVVPILRRMEEQHTGISGTQDKVEAALASWRSGAGACERAQLTEALDALDKGLTEHLAAEEAHVLPLARKHLSPGEWDRLGEEGMAGVPKRRLPLVLGMLMYRADPRVIASMLAHIPRLPRLLLPRLGRRAYRRYALSVHGTAEP